MERKIKMTVNQTTTDFNLIRSVLKDAIEHMSYKDSLTTYHLKKDNVDRIKDLQNNAPDVINDLFNYPDRYLPDIGCEYRVRFLPRAKQLLICHNRKIDDDLLDQLVEADQIKKRQHSLKALIHDPNKMINALIAIVVVCFVIGFIPLLFLKDTVKNICLSLIPISIGLLISLFSNGIVRHLSKDNRSQNALQARIDKINRIYEDYRTWKRD